MSRSFVVVIISWLLYPVFCNAAAVEAVTTEGTIWTVSTWGFSTPKLLYDGDKLYTVALVGEGPGKDVARLFWRDKTGWHSGADIAPVYQPATIVLDDKGRINVFCTQAGVRAFHWRSTLPGEVTGFEQVPLPEPEKFAYGYLGVGRHGNLVALCGLDKQYRMWISTKQGDTPWQRPQLLVDSVLGPTPRVSPVYPIVMPDEHGVHVVYSSCPDGSEGNTYNRVEYAYFDRTWNERTRHDVIVESPMGDLTFGLDALIDSEGSVGVLYNTGLLMYGPPQPDIRTRQGLYYASLKRGGQWIAYKVSDSIRSGQLHQSRNDGLSVFETSLEGVIRHRSGDGGKTWAQDRDFVWDQGTHLYLLKPNSGSADDDRVRGIHSHLLSLKLAPEKRFQLEYLELNN